MLCSVSKFPASPSLCLPLDPSLIRPSCHWLTDLRRDTSHFTIHPRRPYNSTPLIPSLILLSHFLHIQPLTKPHVLSTSMSTNSLTTSNELNDLQRTRLMRSTRKLAAVLGTTPHLLDSPSESEPYSSDTESMSSYSRAPSPDCPMYLRSYSPSVDSRPTSRASRREGRIFTSSASMSSTSSLASWISLDHADFYDCDSARSSASSFHNTPRTPVIPPSHCSSPAIKISLPGLIPEKTIPSKPMNPLNLRLNPIPLSPSDMRFDLTSPLLPPTPRSPDTIVFAKKARKEALDASDRRKKMAKLYRTLGENVPQQLVFRKTKSTDHDADDEDDALLTPKAKSYARSRLPSFSLATTPTTLGPITNNSSHGRSSSLATPQGLLSAAAGTASLIRRGPFTHVRQSTTAFQELHSRCQSSDAVETHQPSRWQGQWSNPDITQVQHALRALKA